MQTQSNTRQQVMAEIIIVGRKAKSQGLDPWKAIEAAFPGIPTDVTAEAWLDVEEEATEAWLQSVEKTIDAEVIRNALAKAGQ